MKLQSLFPQNSANDGLKEICRQVGSDSFYFDVEGIRSNGNIITTGKTFLLLTGLLKNHSSSCWIPSYLETMYTYYY